MIFMQPNASVLEIPLKYFPSRIFGYMAVALKMDYWTVPSVQFGYVAERTLEAGEVQTICDAVEHIVRARGLTGLLAESQDLSSDAVVSYFAPKILMCHYHYWLRCG